MTANEIPPTVLMTRMITGLSALVLAMDVSMPMLRCGALIAGLFFCQGIIEKLHELAEQERRIALQKQRQHARKVIEMEKRQRMLDLFRAHLNGGENHAK